MIGQSSSIYDDDWFYLEMTQAGTISVSFNDGDGSAWSGHDVHIIDAVGNVLASDSIYEEGNLSAQVNSAGNYFVLVENSYDTEDYSITCDIL